jgi:hypothetical protein
MIFIVAAGVYMVSHDSDSLIEDDYYEKGLSYDDVYRRKQNLVDDGAKPIMKVDKDTLFLTFVSDNNKGELMFKRPSDGSLDKKIPFATSTKSFALPISAFAKGNWTLEISWEHDSKSYIDTRPLYIQ